MLRIAREALDFAKANNGNVIIFDTAGRLQIDEPLVQELQGAVAGPGEAAGDPAGAGRRHGPGGGERGDAFPDQEISTNWADPTSLDVDYAGRRSAQPVRR